MKIQIIEVNILYKAVLVKADSGVPLKLQDTRIEPDGPA